MKKKKLYCQPSATVIGITESHGLLTTFSKTNAVNASENDNPPMDAKSNYDEWDDLWE